MSRSARGGLALFVAAAVLIVVATLGRRRLDCEACMEYSGQMVCRTVAGDERAATERVARDNACATLASGRIEQMQCVSSTPVRLECVER